MYTTSAKNVMLSAFGSYSFNVAGHTDFPGLDGASNEISGGSPAYARKTFSMASPSGGVKSAATTPTLDIPGGTSLKWLSTRMIDPATSTETVHAVAPAGGSPQRYHADPSTDTIHAPAHGLVDDDLVVFWGGTVPAGLTEGTEYFVISAATDSFQVSTSSGGSAEDITAVQSGQTFMSVIVPFEPASQATYDVTPIAFDLNT